MKPQVQITEPARSTVKHPLSKMGMMPPEIWAVRCWAWLLHPSCRAWHLVSWQGNTRDHLVLIPTDGRARARHAAAKDSKGPPWSLMLRNFKLQRAFSKGEVNNLLSQRGLGVGKNNKSGGEDVLKYLHSWFFRTAPLRLAVFQPHVKK